MDLENKKILLLGSSGLAGQAYYKFLRQKCIKVYGVARKNSDIQIDLQNFTQLLDCLTKLKPDIIINCAAKIDIEFCENFPAESWTVNSALVSVLSNWSRVHNTPLIQVSTDHFFNKRGPFKNSENDEVYLKNNYARQKYSAERFALISQHALVVRTSFCGIRGWEKKSFAEWALDVVNNDLPANLYEDAWTSTLNAFSMVKTSLELLLKHKYFGIINIGSSEVYSKASFVEELAKQKGVSLNNCKKVSIRKQNNLELNSLGLNVNKAESIVGYEMPSLKDIISNLILEEAGRF